ncbi:exonuclease 1 [Gymnodraco acuticeps]|uniref:Exonuclease 1 n=1 Tax=Gymnodraco acuticeps TaxID=8218 RepID=A0A6P8U2I6_GYMAC|nr:exonuclease 1 [Gymnodraco acuticeps]
MGISGLLQFIKDAGEPISMNKYKGQTVAVDTYCWLHKGAFSCAEKLAKGEPTDQYVWYCMKFVDMLLNFGVKPVLVFDGRNLPSKREVEKARRERRESNLQKGRQLLREGKLSEARDCFTRCVNITPSMAHNLIKVARARGVDCVVAPYEADAQLAYLTKSGLAQAVITEDSDLLAFGCKKVILKMDKQGNGLEIDQDNMGRCRSLGNVFTEEKFRHMCILSGCDYLASLHGIGLGKACKLLRLAKDPDILKVIRKLGQYLKMNITVPEEYIEGFIRANNTFLYQLVFDPVKRKVIPLNPYPEHMDPATLSYAGLNLGDDKGSQMALGNLDINTLERIDDFSPDKPIQQLSKPRSRSWNSSAAPTGPSIWSGGLKAACVAPPRPAASPDRPSSTRGKERVVSLVGLRLPCRELQVKRPREDSSVSDQDVLQQYSSPTQKRSKSDQLPEKPTITRPRNRFATLLQRRNQEPEEDGQATCSRFFSSCSSAASVSMKECAREDLPQDVEPTAVNQDSSPNNQTNGSDDPDIPSVDTPSPPPSPSTTSTCSASQGLKLFRWSGSSCSADQKTPQSSAGLAALQQFHYKKESSSSSTKTHRSSGDTSLPPPSPTDPDPEKKEDLPDSPPSQDSAYFTQSQPHPTSCHKEEILTCNFSSSYQEEAEINSSKDSEPEQSPAHSAEADKRPDMLRPKVSGLSRPKSSSQSPAAKTRTLGPARASGLRRKPVGSGKKTSNNENNPGVQATISNLWKNFSFKKDTQKMTPSQKGEPMSPVKLNLSWT